MRKILACTLFLSILLGCATATAQSRKERRAKRKAKTEKQASKSTHTPVSVKPEKTVTEKTTVQQTEPYCPELNRNLTPAQIDSLVALWREKQTLQSYDTFFNDYIDIDSLASSSDTTPDSVYANRLRALVSPVQLPFNPIVKNYIRRYVDTRYGTINRVLSLSRYYFPLIEEELIKADLPVELRALPIIESALSTTATSPMGAVGLWQFMPATGKSYGLEINSFVDERRDPVQATRAACRYLKDLYSIYHDWTLAIAAYNCGPGNVNKALRRAGGENKDFWSIYYLLPAETRGYVPAFIAANYVMNYYNQHNISPALAKRPIITDSVHVNKRVHLQQIADILNLPIEEIRVLNPQYRRDVIPGDVRPYSLVLPSMQVYSYIMSEDSILSHDYNRYARRKVVEPVTTIDDDPDSDYVKKLVVKRHVVKKGETLSKIAKRYGVKSSDIKKWNGLRKNSLRAGSTLKINTYERVARVKEPEPEPETETTDDSSLAAAESTQSQDDEPNSGTVQPAETLDSTETASQESAAPKVEKPVEKEKTVEKPAPKKNAAKEKAAAKPSYTYHTVKRGETLSKIARKYRGVTIADIQKANGISGSAIQAGQKLKIPRK